MRKILPLLTIVLVLTLVPLIGARAGNIFVVQQISTDPYTNPDSQHQTQVEPDTFAFGSTVVAAFQTGRFYDGGASNNGWATSQDGGASWVHGFLPSMTVNSVPPGIYQRATDPSVAYDPKHNVWLVNSLGMKSSTNDVIVSRSTDGGLTWGAPILVSAGGYYDKNWIGCDTTSTSPFYGNCYVTWDDYNQGDKLYMSVSTDGGLTWGAKKAPKGNPLGLGGQVLAQPSGRVVVPYSDGWSQIKVFGSNNGGSTWTRAKTIATQTYHTVAGGLRASAFLPSAEVDSGGKMYVVWPDCRFRAGCAANDIVMSTSTDGMTWTAPVRIPIDDVTSGVDHFIPGIAATGSGNSAHLALTYYYYSNANCSVSTCQLYVGFLSSIDGGTSWSLPQSAAGPMTLSWIANTSQGRMVGDYISTSFAGMNAVGVFSSASAPIGSTFQQAAWATTIPVTAEQSYPSTVKDEPVLSTKGDALAPVGPVLTP